jgi:hypothetical protein
MMTFSVSSKVLCDDVRMRGGDVLERGRDERPDLVVEIFSALLGKSWRLAWHRWSRGERF